MSEMSKAMTENDKGAKSAPPLVRSSKFKEQFVEFKSFKRKFKSYIDTTTYDGRDTCRVLHGLLEGAALKWYEQLDKAQKTDSETVLELMEKNLFPEHIYAIQTEQRLLNMK